MDEEGETRVLMVLQGSRILLQMLTVAIALAGAEERGSAPIYHVPTLRPGYCVGSSMHNHSLELTHSASPPIDLIEASKLCSCKDQH